MKLLRNKYRWLAILVALWTRGVGFVIGAPPETVDFKTTSFTPLPVVLTEEKDTLIFSDSPEYVNKSGVLAAGTVNGTGRVYFYHVNERTTKNRYCTGKYIKKECGSDGSP